MQTALQDLEALMKQATVMVQLAQSLNKSLTEHEAHREQLPEDAKFIIGSSMARLGLTSETVITPDMVKDDEEWLDELARELGNVLVGSGQVGGLMKDRGIIGLDEVWGGWNRARGVCEYLFLNV